MLHLKQSYLWCLNLETLESRSEIPENIWNVVLEQDGEDQLDGSCDKWRSVTKSRGGEEFPVNNKRRKANGVVTSGVGTAFWNMLLNER